MLRIFNKKLLKYKTWRKLVRHFFILKQIKRRTFYVFWSIISWLVYHRAMFIDTNLILLKSTELEMRPQKFRKFLRNYFITESIEKEISDLDGYGFSRIFPHAYKIIRFSQLRKINPSLCPVYYNLIASMYNPANITSSEFTLHMLQSLKLRNRNLSRAQNTLYMKYMNRIKNGAISKVDKDGNPKTVFAEHLDISFFQYFQKKVKNRNSDNLLNDYKNISLSLLFTLVYKTNTVFLTADRDLLAIIFTLIESIAQELAFHQLILPTLSDNEKHSLFLGKHITRFLDFKELQEKCEGILGDILNPYWKKNYISFRVWLWDDKRKKYIKDFSLNFNKMSQELILHMHGPLSCPFAKNNSHGNWLHYQFWPPLPKSPNVVKILVSAKKIVNRQNINIPDHIHQNTCKYANDDISGNLKKYYGFWM